MYLKAISLGYAVPPSDFEARVHSVFRRSVNLQVEGSSDLLTLTTSSQPDLPQGIRLETCNGLHFDNLKVGERACCLEGILSFQIVPLRVDLRKAHRWRCDLAAMNINMTDPATVLAWSCVWQELNKRQIHAKAEIVAGEVFRSNEEAKATATRKISQAIRKLVQATRNYDLAAIPAAGELIGLGSGLTPSGDDLLVGYLIGLWCTVRKKNDRRNFVTKLGWAIIDLSQGTNDISRTYLFHAARGQVTSHLMELAHAISQGEEPDQLIDTAEVTMSMGHTSGMDAVTGLLLGLTVWTPPITPVLAISPIQS